MDLQIEMLIIVFAQITGERMAELREQIGRRKTSQVKKM